MCSSKGRTLDLGATVAMAYAELGQFAQAAAIQRDLIAAAEKAGLQECAAAGREPCAVRTPRAMPHAVDGRRDAMTARIDVRTFGRVQVSIAIVACARVSTSSLRQWPVSAGRSP